METLNASLLASGSATATLEKWCADHKMADPPTIVARRVPGAEKVLSEETRRRLRLGDDETVKYRRVQLTCGRHVLSEADNWYVPSRLADEINRTLETTQTPFGKAVAALRPFRRTIEMTLQWSPLPDGWELRAPAAPRANDGVLQLPHEIFTHKAVLYTEDQLPFAEVQEHYTGEALDFDVKSQELAPSPPDELRDDAPPKTR